MFLADRRVRSDGDDCGALMLDAGIERQLDGVRRALVFGCGGGYDVVCGLPLTLAFEARGIEVELANCSFTGLDQVRGGRRLSEGLLAVDADSERSGYFPEGHLCRFARQVERRERRVYCFNPAGLDPYRRDVAHLVGELQPDLVLLVDGGVDSLVRGDEFSLGTPLLDALTIGACEPLASRKLLATTASAMLAALDGQHGEHTLNAYMEQTPLWLSPLLLLYWIFDLDAVCTSKRSMLAALEGTVTREQAAAAARIERAGRNVEPWQPIPL